ncbi:hypothetical protein AAZX31_13G026700 [Glycine max]
MTALAVSVCSGLGAHAVIWGKIPDYKCHFTCLPRPPCALIDAYHDNLSLIPSPLHKLFRQPLFIELQVYVKPDRQPQNLNKTLSTTLQLHHLQSKDYVHQSKAHEQQRFEGFVLSYFVQSLRLISLPFSSPHRKRYHTQIQCARSLPILGFNSSWVHFYKIAPMLGEICEQSRRHCTYHQQGRRRSTA